MAKATDQVNNNESDNIIINERPTFEDDFIDPFIISNPDHGWQTVTYKKKSSKKPLIDSSSEFRSNGGVVGSNIRADVFRSVEQQSRERRNRALEAKIAAEAKIGEPVIRSRHWDDSDDGEGGDSDDVAVVENGGAEVKKPKVKKPKKPKVTVAEAAAKIDASDLAAFLIDISASYESQQDIQLMRFADYFARAFSAVGAAQFPWAKLFKESPIAKIVDIPLSYVPESVFTTSAVWISKRSPEKISPFIERLLDSILADLENQQGTVKGSKKVVKQAPSKSQVAIFVVLAITLKQKPDALMSLVPKLGENAKYHGQDRLPLIVWVIVQAFKADTVIGMHLWVHVLVPIVTGKSCNPQSRDMILQLVERFLSPPKALSTLIKNPVRKNERLVPPSAFELLMRVTFPASSARVKATERFEAVYPIMKELAFAGLPGTKAMKPTSEQIFRFAVKLGGEPLHELSKEATSVCLSCLTQNPDLYNLWDEIYLDNIKASVSVLKKLSEELKLKGSSVKFAASLHSLREALKSFRQKNEKVLADGEGSDQQYIREADKYCKVIMGRFSRGRGCMKSAMLAVFLVSIGAYAIPLIAENGEFKELYEKLYGMLPQELF
ncbi:hypothetical protein GIB67_002522 [Kingdonia uniflora]|uniref:Transmembrane protein n=1 Tax=Kingdonia uniflora TaxID=39325 RepID=A0A7J7N8P7_9MAGN|nr:hypothetical protein GIB67_002522 [Kingdonia uniflora]